MKQAKRLEIDRASTGEQTPRAPRADAWRWSIRSGKVWHLVLLLVALLSAASPALVRGQTFQAVPALSFSKVYGGGNPLPQVFTVASTTSTKFSYSVAVSTTSGGAC